MRPVFPHCPQAQWQQDVNKSPTASRATTLEASAALPEKSPLDKYCHISTEPPQRPRCPDPDCEWIREASLLLEAARWWCGELDTLLVPGLAHGAENRLDTSQQLADAVEDLGRAHVDVVVLKVIAGGGSAPQ